MNSGIEITWLTNTTDRDDFELSVTDEHMEEYVEKGGFQVYSRRDNGNYTSTLHVNDLGLNGTNLTCEGSEVVMSRLQKDFHTIRICIVGKFSYQALL